MSPCSPAVRHRRQHPGQLDERIGEQRWGGIGHVRGGGHSEKRIPPMGRRPSCEGRHVSHSERASVSNRTEHTNKQARRRFYCVEFAAPDPERAGVSTIMLCVQGIACVGLGLRSSSSGVQPAEGLSRPPRRSAGGDSPAAALIQDAVAAGADSLAPEPLAAARYSPRRGPKRSHGSTRTGRP